MNLDGNSVDLIDQNEQYYYETTTGDGQMVMVGGKLKLKLLKFKISYFLKENNQFKF